MKTMISAIFAVSALLVGASSFADKRAPQPPPQQQQYDDDQDDCSDGSCETARQAPVDDDYYGPGQDGLYGEYDVDCLPEFDEDLYYRCPYPDVFACAPIEGGIYGPIYPYPPVGVVLPPVLAQRWWGAYGPRGLINIYRGGYRGSYMPRVVRPFAPNMIPPRPAFVPRPGYGPRGPVVGGVPNLPPPPPRGFAPRGVPPGMVVGQPLMPRGPGMVAPPPPPPPRGGFAPGGMPPGGMPPGMPGRPFFRR